MEKAKAFLELTQGESDRVSSLAFPPHRLGTECSFYEYYSLRGIRVDRIEPGQLFCTFKVPPRLTDREGKLASGAIANLVDEVGGAVVYVEGLPMNVSVDMSISFLSSAKAGRLLGGILLVRLAWEFEDMKDELEVIGRVLGQKGGYSGTSVLVKNKTTGELIAEGRHSLFGKHASKM
uniref:Thioesterase domain-containing protein n=1 Tax=Solanum lycopersicum TaxID=4081 RepID=A0A3Q7H1N1_SOLLC